ncbi:uncharacterized protein LOC131321208 [Rhododendron vialii]|uniref:uncharacterized protein LOC131321208 n=1 Tax=Rhododendron vialii TaxID=182163 RepID=UPI00265DB34D|nr:uncharacterized protein LOC131321208 [Rhododendron vialii]
MKFLHSNTKGLLDSNLEDGKYISVWVRTQRRDVGLSLSSQKLIEIASESGEPESRSSTSKLVGPAPTPIAGDRRTIGITKDAAFCLYCYLFKPDIGDQAGGESFVGNGFSNWKKKRRLRTHVGGHNSAHTQAWRKCEDLLNQKQHIETIVLKQSEQARIDYRTRLNASIDCARFLLNQGLAFRGHDESEFSHNQGNFLELLKLSIGRLRRQGYDGASNMQGEINASCKRRDILRENEVERVVKALNLGEIESGRGLNQETSLKRLGDTRWSSHYSSLVRLMGMFASAIGVLEIVEEDGTYLEQRLEATSLLESMQSFEFILYLHMMRTILGITNDLSQALQRKDQDIVNAMALLQLSKGRLQTMRESGWITLLNVTSSFCEKHEIVIPNMDDLFVPRGGKRRKAHKVTNLHHFCFEIFNSVIDMQAIELDARFPESTTELLLCVACLNPSNLFSSFDKEKLIHTAEFYPQDFSSMDPMILDDQLDNYIDDMRTTIEFSSLHGISDLAQKMVEIGKHRAYPLVYLLLVLALTLPVATATVERAFSAMNYVKNQWRN